MEINSAYQTQSLWDLDSANSVEQPSKNSADVKAGQKGGDTVEISNDARELFSQMIHKYEGSNASAKDATQDFSDGGNEAGGSAGGGSGGASSGTSADSLRSQIQALKSQLAAVSSDGDGSSTGQASGLSAQIAALEAQLQSAESAG